MSRPGCLLFVGPLGACALAAPSPSRADTLRQWQDGDWRIEVFANTEAKAFQNCRAVRLTDTGGSFVLAALRDAGWAVGFVSAEKAQQQTGTMVPIDIRIDQNARTTLTGRVTNGNSLEVRLPSGAEFIDEMRRGRTMTFSVPDGRHGTVLLEGMTRVSASLAQCVQAQMAAERTGAGPQQAAAPPPAAAPGAPQSSPAFELAATRIASNLLLQAKLSNARLLGPTETPPS
jgi:hypothetical protein